MSLKINSFFLLVLLTFFRIYSFYSVNEVSLLLCKSLLKTKNKCIIASATGGFLLAIFIYYKMCKNQSNTLKITEKPMDPKLTLQTNIKSKNALVQLFSPQMIVACMLYTLLIRQPFIFSEINNTTLPFLYEKMQKLSETEFTRMYELLCLKRQRFLAFNEGLFSLPNSIEAIPSTKYFGQVDMVKKQIAKDALTTHAIVHQRVITLITDFIAYKSQYSEHKDFFKRYLNKEYEYINRLLTRRPMCFYGAHDYYKLPSSSTITKDRKLYFLR